MKKEPMIRHNLEQGTPEWHKFRAEHYGASEASAMLGISSYMSRVDLQHLKHTGETKEVGSALQAVFDRGHQTEAMARPIIEEMIGDDLYPVTCSRGKRSASCDGLTMGHDDGEVAFEHKQWNEKLAASISRQELPAEHMPQCQQVMEVTGASRLIFVVSDGTKQNMVYMTVLPDEEYQNKIIAGWEQFDKDQKDYVPQPVFKAPEAEAVMALPALVVQVRGEVTTSNMKEFGEATDTYLANIKTELVTDQDFANAKDSAKTCRETVAKLELTKENMLAQTVTIGEAVRMIDKWKEDYRLMALDLEKKVVSETEARRVAIIQEHKQKFVDHAKNLADEIVDVTLKLEPPDFAAAMKGKKSIKGWQDAANAALSNGIIEADTIAKDIRGKLAWCKETSAGFGFLFNDLQQIITKPLDDFKLLVTTRIDGHKRAEAEKVEAQRAQIRAEEEAKARREAEAKLRAEQEEADRVKAAELEAANKSARDVQEAVAIEERRKQAQIDESAQLNKKPVMQVYSTEQIDDLHKNTSPFPTRDTPVVIGVDPAQPGSDKAVVVTSRPTRAAIIGCISAHFGVNEYVALDWILAEFRGDIEFEARREVA